MLKTVIKSVVVASVIFSVIPNVSFARDAGGDGGGDNHFADRSVDDDDQGRGRDAGRNPSHSGRNPFPPIRVAVNYCENAIQASSHCIDERL